MSLKSRLKKKAKRGFKKLTSFGNRLTGGGKQSQSYALKRMAEGAVASSRIKRNRPAGGGVVSYTEDTGELYS